MTNHHTSVSINEEKERLMIQLRPYEDIILRIEEILYGKQPLLLLLFVAIFDAVLIFAHLTQMGIFALFISYCIIIYLIYFLQHRFNIMRLIPKVDLGLKENAGEVKLHSFEEICQYLAQIRQTLGMIVDYLLGNQFEGIYKICYVLAVWFTLAFVFNIIGNFWLFFIIINLSLLTPGFNIIVLIFGWVGQLSRALFGVFLNPQNNQQQGEGPPTPNLPQGEESRPPQPQEEAQKVEEAPKEEEVPQKVEEAPQKVEGTQEEDNPHE